MGRQPAVTDAMTSEPSLTPHPSPLTPRKDRPHATVLYHYFHPDDVVSARLLSDLAAGLAERGWDVTAVPCFRGCHDERKTYPRTEHWNGVRVERIWRPRFRQASNLGRLLNAGWMIASWSLHGLMGKRHPSEVMIVGTDPVLSAVAAVAWKLGRPSCKVAHWVYDLYPDAPIAEGMVRPHATSARVLRRLMAFAYRRCDLLADIGPCMRHRMSWYRAPVKRVTLTPWALVEPGRPAEADPATRRELFGDATLGLLYSGSFGRAHGYAEFLALARELRGDPVRFCFAGRGNRMDELKKAVTADDANVTFAGFAPEAELEKRLGACDLHLVSLRPEWTGTVVPSKFFGALAAGRGVLFAGSPGSAIAQWVRKFEVGWVVTADTVADVAGELRRLAADPAGLLDLRKRCFAVYHAHFAKMHQIDLWDDELRGLIGRYNRWDAAPRPGASP
jgi:colanic acid biosynthesis glycosyl transferase WcaI